jgi:LysR family transcriptional regulator, hydrogen peroxide-inducible genes activator
VNLRDLRYLVALADTRHFGRAAERCHVSQPTLSAQIKKLERYLGVELVERQPRRVTLTETGEQVVARARRVLQEADEIVALTRNRSDPLAGRLNLALIPTIGPYLLPRVSNKLRRQLPRLKLMLYEYRTEQLLERLRNGEIDLGILALPVPLDGLDVRELYEEPFRIALPKNHELARKGTLRLADIAKENLLLLEDGHCLRDQALEVCSRAQMHEDQDYRATSLETLRQMVAAGLGVTLLPDLATRAPMGSSQGLAIRNFAAPQPMRTVGAVWRRSSTRTAAIEAVCRVIRSEMVKE